MPVTEDIVNCFLGRITAIDEMYFTGYNMRGSSDIEIKVLTLENGKRPFQDWYRSITDFRVRARIDARIMRIRAGNFGDAKNVGQGVSELRLDFGPGYRVYFARLGNIVVVLLGVGDKSSQSTDILEMQALWERYRNAPDRFQ